MIAKEFPTRSARQLRERWRFYLNPQLDKNPFTSEEDKIIVEGQKLFGNSWKTIPEILLQIRTDIAIRSRFCQLNKESIEDESIQIDFFNFQFNGANEDFFSKKGGLLSFFL
jgi:hypothetical protein